MALGEVLYFNYCWINEIRSSLYHSTLISSFECLKLCEWWEKIYALNIWKILLHVNCILGLWLRQHLRRQQVLRESESAGKVCVRNRNCTNHGCHIRAGAMDWQWVPLKHQSILMAMERPASGLSSVWSSSRAYLLGHKYVVWDPLLLI